MKNLTKNQKAIVDAYLAAKISGKWDEGIHPQTIAELRKVLVEGKVLKAVMEEAEIRAASITSIVLASTFDHLSESYKRGIRKAFRRLFANLNIT